MFKPFAILPIVAAVVLAQGSTTSTLIPSGISDTCKTFLTALNTNSDVTACTKAVIQATASLDASKNSSSTDITSTLGNLCSSTTTNSCISGVISPLVSQFGAACSAELTSAPNTDVARMYDTLYTMVPFIGAICSKDDNGNYCAMEDKLPSDVEATSLAASLSTSPPSNSKAVIPNVDVFQKYNISFLFLSTSLSSSAICNGCTRKIMTSYMNYQTQTPYTPGLAQSAMLSQQPDLYSYITSACGSTFFSDASVVKAAGGLAGGTMGGSTNGATQVGNAISSLIAAATGLVTFLML